MGKAGQNNGKSKPCGDRVEGGPCTGNSSCKGLGHKPLVLEGWNKACVARNNVGQGTECVGTRLES